MYDQLKRIFQTITPLNEEEWRLIECSFFPKEVPAKQLLTILGQIENHAYFIRKGILRLFCYNPKGEEVTIFLFKENNFASSYQSFLTQTPSKQVLETIEDCSLLCIDRASMDKLYQDLPKMNIITRTIAEQRFINAQSIFSSNIMNTNEERYLEFEKQHGDLLLRVPHHIIASFLGMTPVSMSRIRNRIYQKKLS